MLSRVVIISSSVFMCEASMQSSDVFRPQKKLPVEKSKKKMFFQVVGRKPNTFLAVCQSNKKELDI